MDNLILKTAILGMAMISGAGFAQTPAQTTPAPTTPAQATPAAEDPAVAQAEYATYTAATKETDPAKKLVLLKDWSQKSPDSKYKKERNYLFIDSYSRIGASVMGGTPSEQQLKDAEAADREVLDKADVLFAPDMKLSNATDAQWTQAKAAVTLAANQSLAAIYAARKDYPSLEKQDMKLIEMNPNDAKAALQLGTTIYMSGKVERRPESFYQYARAISISGPGALDPAAKKSTEDYLDKAYKGYHGDDKGLSDLKAMAAKTPMPPADFHIESVTDISKKEIAGEEEFNKSHPEIVAWRNVKATLTAPNGEAYFTKDVKGAEFPKTVAKVVSQPNDKELTVAVDDATPETAAKAEATLKFTDATIKGTVAPGTEITFTNGVPASFTSDPYMIVFDVERANVQGVELAPAAATRKAPVRSRKKTK